VSNKIRLQFKKDENSVEKLQTQNSYLKSFKCPQCSHVIHLNENQIQEKILECPICHQQNLLKLPSGTSKKKQTLSYLNGTFSQLDKNAVILGLILLFASLVTFLVSPYISFKMTLTLVIIGVIISAFVVEKQKDISLKVAVCIILFIIFLYFITGAEIEIFLILIFIGVSIVKILLDEYLPHILKMRMYLFLSAFFVIFMFFVIKRIINVVNI
jgi:hypothetical protein